MKIETLIKKKLLYQELNQAEIAFLVEGYANYQISDAEMSSMLDAFVKTEMTENETLLLFDYNYKNLTKKISLQNVEGFKIDKHSSGGVGDGVSLILLPVLAALGFKVFKISGGRLGFTGGTVEKLHTFEGINLKISDKELQKRSQTAKLIITDLDQINRFGDRLYALSSKRLSLTETGPDARIVGLTACGIMIKKMVLQSDCLLLDVKIGSGAFFKTLEEGEEYVRMVTKIVQKYNYKTVFFFTDMNSPLGDKIGNKLEVLEAVEAFGGKIKPALFEVITNMVHQAYLTKGALKSLATVQTEVQTVLNNGQALANFKTMIESQGGNFAKFWKQQQPVVKYQLEIKSWMRGYLDFFDAAQIGALANDLNILVNGQTDYEGGIIIKKRDNAFVEKGETVALIYTNNSHFNDLTLLMTRYQKGVKISPKPLIKNKQRIIKIVKSF